MVVTTNYKYAHSSSNDYVIKIVQISRKCKIETNFFSISKALIAELKNTTIGKLFYPRDMSRSEIASVAR